MSRPLKMGAAALVVAASVLLSRVLGLLREILLATLIGVNVEGDLYRQAFLIPDFLNYLLAGAYLTITLIPILSRHLAQGDLRAASEAFTSVFRFVAVAVLGLTALMWVFAQPLVGLVFPEVVEEQARLVSLTRLVLPAQVFLVLGALLMAVQYTHRRFLIPAMAPLIYNLGIIAGGLLVALAGDPSPEGFLWGAVIGSAVGNFAFQAYGARRTGTWLIRHRVESSVGEYLLLALPLMIGQSIAALDEQFVRFFGQVEEGATSALSFARQLNMLPVGVIGQAAGVAAFPFLAALAARGNDVGLARTTTRASRITVYVSFLAVALFYAVSLPLVRLLYRWGEFTDTDAVIVAGLLAIYAFSIPAWGLHQIMARQFYARRNMWTPVVIGTAVTIGAIPLWLWLRDLRGVEGMALASTIAMTTYAVALVVAWWLKGGRGHLAPLGYTVARGALVATAAGWLGRQVVVRLGGTEVLTFGEALGTLVFGTATVLAMFILGSMAVRSPEIREVFRRGGRRDIPPALSDGRE